MSQILAHFHDVTRATKMPKDNNARTRCPPFLKWPGGKRWLAPLLSHILTPELSKVYFEPFAGAAAVFLELSPREAVLSDTNTLLVETLMTVRERPTEVVERIWKFTNTAECYYSVRASTPRTSLGRAARFIYLNRTCWGGIYRLNHRGDFNVPFGNSGRRLCSQAVVREVARRLELAHLKVSDFEVVISQAKSGDVVYADPPYTTRGENNGFVRYNESLFSWSDQMRLAATSRAAQRRGVFVAISGLFHSDVLSLYPGWWVLRLSRSSRISRERKGRKLIHEALILSRRPKCASEREALHFRQIKL